MAHFYLIQTNSFFFNRTPEEEENIEKWLKGLTSLPDDLDSVKYKELIAKFYSMKKTHRAINDSVQPQKTISTLKEWRDDL